MALSNIFREPRRELIESGIGIVAVFVGVGGLGYLDYLLAAYLYDPGDKTATIPLLMFLVPLFAIIFFIVAGLCVVIIHEIGEAICNAFQRRGIHLRPRQRY